MDRNTESCYEILSAILDIEDGAYMRKDRPSNPSSANKMPTSAHCDASVLREAEQFIAKHRFAIATALCRCLLRKWHAELKGSYLYERERTAGGAQLLEPPINI